MEASSHKDELGAREPPRALEAGSHGDDELENGLAALQVAIDLMYHNKYHEAVRLLKPKAEVSMYHSMAYGTVLFLQAGFCMEKEAIDNATVVLMKTLELTDRCRRPRGMMESLSGWVFGQRLDSHTPSELQAEVLHAEANLLLSFLIFIQDESLISFVKGGLRIRNCYSSYKQLHHWLNTCAQEGVEVEINFATGVRMGYGCFNLFLSLLPARILKLLEFVGFSVDRTVGLAELERAASNTTFRAPFCSSFLLLYYTVVSVFTGIEVESGHAQRLLQPQLAKYPQSVQFLYFKGRVEAMGGDIDKAIQSFQAAMDAQTEWKQVFHLCWWEMAWCHSLKSEWGLAAQYSHCLYKDSKWSKASFLYMKASFLLMQRELALPSSNSPSVDPLQDQSSPSTEPGQSSPSTEPGQGPSTEPGQSSPSTEPGQGSPSTEPGLVSPSTEPGLGPSTEPGQGPSTEPGQGPSTEPGQGPSTEPGQGSPSAILRRGCVSDEELADMMRNIPPLKQRIAGKSLPIEKFGVAKSARFLSGGLLPLSGMELLYSHNAFWLLRNNQPLLKHHLQHVCTKLLELEHTKETNKFYRDDWTVATFLQGCILRILERHAEAEICFLDVLNKSDALRHDLYTVPAAMAELGLLYITTGNLEEAQRNLESARTNYKGYHLESRIHFRIHAGLNRIKQLSKST